MRGSEVRKAAFRDLGNEPPSGVAVGDQDKSIGEVEKEAENEKRQGQIPQCWALFVFPSVPRVAVFGDDTSLSQSGG